ncbi:ferredoxin reductase [Paraburkholderia sp. 1N]|uniref:Ferredoxin reductase n=1 Tax=Paraburkholderia solitsugae TaxID=2675748 RepID=A0ABX2C2K5_9BURK|nr:FAD-dependent oxidoreductase [Paraburkholderia solitsugae]NPT47252.1 ferredoxin reductase [Paraburkholderia solitsugae]
MAEHVVIVGAGHAGGSVATYLRQYGYEGQVTLVGNESAPPYQRPPLSKGWLRSEITLDDLLLKPLATYEQAGIDLRLNSVVKEVETKEKRIILEDGETIDFDKLVFATGARPRRLTLPGSELRGVIYLRDVTDAALLRSCLDASKRIVVMGGGYVGLEVAATARQLGLEVMIVEREARLLSRSASPELAARLLRIHESNGVEFRFLGDVAEIVGSEGKVSGLRFNDGERIECDVILAGIGAQPNVALLEGTGIPEERGIRVDSEGRTSHPDVYAVGDVTLRPVANFEGIFTLESVPSAIEQAKRLSCLIAQRDFPPHELPWFWSQQYDFTLQIAGLPGLADEILVRDDVSKGTFLVFHLRNGALCAAECMNSPGEFLALKKAITHGARPDEVLLADLNTPIIKVLT